MAVASLAKMLKQSSNNAPSAVLRLLHQRLQLLHQRLQLLHQPHRRLQLPLQSLLLPRRLLPLLGLTMVIRSR